MTVNCRRTEAAGVIARQAFNEPFAEELYGGSFDRYVSALIHKGASVIRKVACDLDDDSIGGTIRCAVLRSDGIGFEKHIVN